MRGILDDVLGLVSQNLPGEIRENLLEAGRDRELLQIFARHLN